jgi:hypothetical protein
LIPKKHVRRPLLARKRPRSTYEAAFFIASRSANPICEIMTPDRERWAEALAIERQHGDSAIEFVAGRISACSLAGDDAGVERLRQIADRLDQLRNPRTFLRA